MKSLYLIDGHALIFKMYYAFLRRPMINSKGMDTSILFGFTKYLFELITREKPTHLAVSFDPPGGTFRNQLYPAYKANRPPTPQLIIDALEPLTRILEALRIPVLMLPGFEADDVIGSMARRAEGEGFTVYMVTPDKDYGQLISPSVIQLKPGKGGGPDERVALAELQEKWGIERAEQVVDMLTLCGDTADNVPGVHGIGEVGAAKLIAKYGSVEEIYAHLEELTPRQQAQFEEARGHIALSKELVTIKTDIPLSVTEEQLRVDANYDPSIRQLFDYYEFNSLKKYINHVAASSLRAEAIERLSAPSDFVRCTQSLQTAPLSQASSLRAEAIENRVAPSSDARCTQSLQTARFSPTSATPAFGIDSAVPPTDLPVTPSEAKESFSYEELPGDAELERAMLEDPEIEKVGMDLKRQANELAEEGIALRGRWVDIELMHYLVNPERSHALDVLVSSYLGMTLEEEETVEAPKELELFADSTDKPWNDENGDAPKNDNTVIPSDFSVIPSDFSVIPSEAKESIRTAALLLPLAEKVEAELEVAGMKDLYDRIEEPLAKVLSKMERAGVKIDPNRLAAFADVLRAEIAERETRVRDLAGEPELNVSSPKQIGDVLFDKLGLDPKAKKSARGQYTTDEATLVEIADRHPVVNEILEYRAAKKLLSTYIEPLPSYISPRDGRIHTTFNQALTATGRLSSSNPNLQNIPIRTERGREIRAAFVSGSPNGLILSADYSQIELRIMAHLSGDAHLIEAFRSGEDVHRATAAKIFGLPIDAVTPEQRRMAKTANFGIMYGISSFGLAQRLQVGRKEAKALIDDYFASFPSIRAYIESTLVFARENGYVETLFGRRRYLPDINARNGNIRSMAERTAVNAPIQGTAADIIKLAMIEVDRRMEAEGLRSRMVLQIHDELVFDVIPEEADRLRALVVDAMEHIMELSVPLTVECNVGKNWLEAH